MNKQGHSPFSRSTTAVCGGAVAAWLLVAGASTAFAQGNRAGGASWELTPGADPITLAESTAKLRFTTLPRTAEQAEWTVSVPVDGLLEFEWQYTPGVDSAGRHDTAGYRNGETSVQLTSPDRSVEQGRLAVPVKAAVPLTFWILPEGKSHAPGKLTLKNVVFTSYPRVDHINLNPSSVGITFQPSPGRVNRVQACRDLNTMEWFDVSPDILTLDAQAFYEHARAAGDNMFYRIVVLPDAQ